VIGFVLKGYPRLSETFIAEEIRALERRGLDIRIISLRRPTDRIAHPVHGDIAAAIIYLPEYLHHEPLRVWRAWRAVRRRAGYRESFARWLRDLRRDPSRNRLRRFGQALVLAHEAAAGLTQLHAHFLHTPASVARYAAGLVGLPWSVSAHAKDIWTLPDWEAREKLAECRWAVTCTAIGHRHLAALAPDAGRVLLSYHGLDLTRFTTPPTRSGSGPVDSPRADVRPGRDGSDPGDPVMILSVGRAVAKKGYHDLLAALALLPGGLAWRFVHIGGGTLAGELRNEARRLGLADRIEWRGAAAQEAVLAAYRAADLFVLASRVAADGDRDGLPNVLVEAGSQRLACLSTRVSAVPELIEEGQSGLLVEPGDPAGLARALEQLIRTPSLRDRLGCSVESRVRRDFAQDRCIESLAHRFGLAASAGLASAGLTLGAMPEAACASLSTHR
jgi:glycosyltransferase involved in cell wall biosynthesis